MTSLDGLAHTCHARPIDSAVMAGTLHSAMHMKVPVPSVPRLCLTVALLSVLFQALLERAQGAPVPVDGTMVYTQNFDSLGTASRPWANDSTIPGWYAQINNGSTATGSAQASDGTAANLSGLLNLGAAGSPDRALGSKATSTGGFANISYGVQFQNTSASQIRVLRVTYTGELWRTNSTTEGQEETLVPCYAVSSTKITDIRSGASADFASAGSGFTGLGVGSAWTSTNNLPPASHHNGNAPENRTTVSYFSSAPIVNPGQYVVIKWTDANEGGSDGYLGLDDVTIEFETLSGRPGSVDLSFNPILASTAANSYTDVNTLALQADGKILVGGYFHSVDGALRSHMARLNPDGTPDTDFDPAAGSNVRHFAIYGDGRILFGGDFTTVGAAETLRLARVDSQGIFDPSYLPSADDRVYTSLRTAGNSKTSICQRRDTSVPVPVYTAAQATARPDGWRLSPDFPVRLCNFGVWNILEPSRMLPRRQTMQTRTTTAWRT